MTDTANTVTLVVGGKEFGGWKSVRIEAGIERQARSFDLEVTDKWPGQTDIPRRIQPGDACQVFIGADLVMTGYVDGTPIRYDPRTVGVGVKGRSKTADLVDCCPIPGGQAVSGVATPWADVVGVDGKRLNIIKPPALSANQWRGQKLEVIAAALAAPYGVRVVAETDTGKAIADHHVQVGETVFQSIDRMMRLRHVLSTDNERGDLVLIEVGGSGRATTAIELGSNVMAASTDLDYKNVFSQYIVKGQRAGDDSAFADDVSEEEGTSEDDSETTLTGETADVTDAMAKRRRILVLKQAGQADEGTCQDRANYERAHRRAQALQTSYTLAGWRQESGELWKPNVQVRVRDALIGFDLDMLIAEVAYVLDNKGLRTEVRVGPIDGYVSKAAKLKKGKKGKGSVNWSDAK
jgi:prophage tail gpP-like protein